MSSLTHAEWESMFARPIHEWREAIVEASSGLEVSLQKLDILVEATGMTVGTRIAADPSHTVPPFPLACALNSLRLAQAAYRDALYHLGKESAAAAHHPPLTGHEHADLMNRG